MSPAMNAKCGSAVDLTWITSRAMSPEGCLTQMALPFDARASGTVWPAPRPRAVRHVAFLDRHRPSARRVRQTDPAHTARAEPGGEAVAAHQARIVLP